MIKDNVREDTEVPAAVTTRRHVLAGVFLLLLFIGHPIVLVNPWHCVPCVAVRSGASIFVDGVLTAMAQIVISRTVNLGRERGGHRETFTTTTVALRANAGGVHRAMSHSYVGSITGEAKPREFPVGWDPPFHHRAEQLDSVILSVSTLETMLDTRSP